MNVARPGMPTENQIRVLVVHDQPVLRQGIINSLAGQKHLTVVCETGDSREALRLVRQFSPDVVAMDMELLEVTRILLKENPNLKVVILCGNVSAEHVHRIIESGAQGCVSKGASSQELRQAIETVSVGGSFFGKEFAQVGSSQVVRSNQLKLLSRRELQVLAAIAAGWTNKNVGNFLGISVRTVEMHRARLMRKLNIHSAAGLTRFAIGTGVVVSCRDHFNPSGRRQRD
jgi:two-component system nitrate/nitrite response regulator NarL